MRKERERVKKKGRERGREGLRVFFLKKKKNRVDEVRRQNENKNVKLLKGY